MRITVSGTEAGQKLLKFLLRRSDGSKIYLFKLFRKGQIRVNDGRCDRDYTVRAGDVIECGKLNEFQSVQVTETAGPVSVNVLFENGDMIAVDKDGVTPVQPGAEGVVPLTKILAAYLFQNGCATDFLAPVHRIDRETRGVVLFAKNYGASRRLTAYFRDGLVEKTYLALLEGSLEGPFFLEAAVERGEDGRSVVKKLVMSATGDITPGDRSKWLTGPYHTTVLGSSATVVRPVGVRGNNTLCEIDIWTGRHHQIRAVCAAAGHPVSGDRLYGSGPDPSGLGLIAWKLSLPAAEGQPAVVIQSRQSL